MTVYTNKKADSPILSTEFTPVSDGNFCFFTLRDDESAKLVKEWLASAPIDQEVIAETSVSGHPVLVTHGDRTSKALLQQLEAKGEELEFNHEATPPNYWAIRGGLSVVGQCLQLTSGCLRQGGLDSATIVFAISNLAANGINILFGSQKAEDTHRLKYLKTAFNKKLGPQTQKGEELPEPGEDRMTLRKEPESSRSFSEKAHDFFQRYSVSFGEIGLRFFAATALAFPLKKENWRNAIKALESGSAGEAYRAVRNSTNGRTNLDHYIGLTYLLGKSISLFSKTPDPYNPKPHTMLDTFREKYVFRLSSLIEGAGAATIGYNAFKNKKIKIGDTNHPDYFGGVGGLLFSTAFIVRYFAKFGERKVDKQELLAHITDSLAKMPPDKLPQMMAEAAATIKEHFKDEKMDFGQVFTQMMSDLYRYHHIALDNLGTEPEERLAGADDDEDKKYGAQKVMVNLPGQQTATTKKILAKPARSAGDHTPAASHTEAALKPSDPQVGAAL